MIRRIIFAAGIITALCISACDRITPEIVEYNNSYTPDEPKGINRDEMKKPPVNLLDKYVYFPKSNETMGIYIDEDPDTHVITAYPDNDNITVRLALSKKMKEAVSMEISVMTEADYPKTYKSLVMGTIKLLPEEAYGFSDKELKFEIGDIEKQFTISLKVDKLVKLLPDFTYIIPIVAKAKGNSDFKYHNYFLLKCNVDKN